MGLFIVSFILVALSSLMITATLEKNNFIKIFIYFFTIVFATVVADIEILSLFKQISAINILILNILNLLAAAIFWIKRGKPLFCIDKGHFIRRFKFAILSDKYLFVLGLSFLFMCSVSLFLIAVLPIVNADAEAYHVLRSVCWVSNKTLNHFPIADIRNIVMPINSEILYLWVIVFLKKVTGLGIFSFAGFFTAIFSLYGIMQEIGIKERQKLWVILILSSFPSVVVQISGTETDLIISGLVLGCMYLFLNYVKRNENNSVLYMSALSYALAIGTKSPSLFLIFPVGLWMLWIGYKYSGKKIIHVIYKFLAFGTVNFLIFSSYNYVLNFLDYGSIFGSKSFLDAHKNLYGLKGAAAGFIKHIFLFLDFTGFRWNSTLGTIFEGLKNNILNGFNLQYIPDGFYNYKRTDFNGQLIEPVMGMSLLGFLLYLPCWIYSMVKAIFRHDKKTIFLAGFGYILLGSIVVMSLSITYMAYSIRFLTCFCVISAPILVYSYFYKKNGLIKFFITVIAMFGMLVISTHLWARPFFKTIHYLKNNYSLSDIREFAFCSKLITPIPQEHFVTNAACKVRNYIMSNEKNRKILYFSNQGECSLVIKSLEFFGYKIDYNNFENFDNINFDNYDTILIVDNSQIITSTKLKNVSGIYEPSSGITCEQKYTYEDNIDTYKKYTNFVFCNTNEYTFAQKGYELKQSLQVDNKDLNTEFPVRYMFYHKK